jgi:hypothetical protein
MGLWSFPLNVTSSNCILRPLSVDPTPFRQSAISVLPSLLDILRGTGGILQETRFPQVY